jgi:hypothetical protein
LAAIGRPLCPGGQLGQQREECFEVDPGWAGFAQRRFLVKLDHSATLSSRYRQRETVLELEI